MSKRSHTPKGQLSRARILRAAEPLLAGRGFHGTSMRDVAEASGLPLASVVYHFARKESLHAAVLDEIATQLIGTLDRARTARPSSGEPGQASTRAIVQWSLRNPRRVRLLLRELLDNPTRIARARSLPFAPVLTRLASVAAANGAEQPELAVLHFLGAVSYVVAARPTLRRIVGERRDREIMATYEEHASSLARQVFAGVPGSEASTGDRA